MWNATDEKWMALGRGVNNSESTKAIDSNNNVYVR